MPHVDEGVLHAYLDGALQAVHAAGALPSGMSAADVELHLRVCADCRALLENERAIRDRAGVVLADAGAAAIDLPPFETIMRPAAPRERGSWLPLAWAATVVLALGAGWIAGELLRGDTLQLGMNEAEPAPPTPRADAQAFADTAVETREAVAAAAPEADRVAPRTATPERIDEAPAAAGAVAALQQAQRQESGDIVVRSAAPAVGAAQAPPAAPPQPTPATQLPARSAAMQAGAAAVPSSPADAAEPLLVLFREYVGRARAGELEWLSLSRDELRRSTTPALMVADAEQPALDASVGGGVPAGLVRVRQRLASGELAELLMWRAPAIRLDAVTAEAPRTEQQQRSMEAAPATLATVTLSFEDLSAGEHEIVLFVPALETWVSIRARVPAAQLRALAERLVPVR